MKSGVIIAIFSLFWAFLAATPARAAEGRVLGIHILHPYELNAADQLLTTQDGDWHYVTIPLSLSELDSHAKWQEFFNSSKDKKIIPIVRLVTKFEDGAWIIPTRKHTVEMINFLNTLEWPTDQKHIIIYNEPNHAKEWGGQIAPAEYARALEFAADWAKAADSRFVVLPAGLDLAAPNGAQTMDSFTYLEQMYAAQPQVFAKIDAWNSHSYPNPGFSSSPYRTAKNSLRGFEHELDYLKNRTGRDFLVYITETGWIDTFWTRPRLAEYYQYAMQQVWNDQRVVAVTPFLLQGAPGPFSQFSFLDESGLPTPQYLVYRQLLEQI